MYGKGYNVDYSIFIREISGRRQFVRVIQKTHINTILTKLRNLWKSFPSNVLKQTWTFIIHTTLKCDQCDIEREHVNWHNSINLGTRSRVHRLSM